MSKIYRNPKKEEIPQEEESKQKRILKITASVLIGVSCFALFAVIDYWSRYYTDHIVLKYGW